MDAVEVPIPVATVKLKAAVLKQVEHRESGGRAVNRCSSFVRDVVADADVPASVSWNKMSDPDHCRRVIRMPMCQYEDLSQVLTYGSTNTNSSTSLIPRTEGKKLQGSGKVARSGNNCSKRQRTVHMEESMSQDGADDFKDLCNKLGPYFTKSTCPDKPQSVRQKNTNGKRSDKRNLKAPSKTRFDPFALKSGLGNFSLSAGGNNFLGTYGLKPDIHDITKDVEELLLSDLLEGRYEFRSVDKDKGKKTAPTNENIMDSVRKAYDRLQLPRPVRPQQSMEIESSSNRKVSAGLLSSVSCPPSTIDCDKGDNDTTDLPSSCKVQGSCSKSETLANTLDCPFMGPKDVLERLALPSPKDLDSLLLDTTKPAGTSRNTPELRLGKSISNRVSLPPFPWSQTFGGNSKTNSDAAKLQSSKGTCQGRWVRIEPTANTPRGLSECFTDLKSLTYDHGLVPFVEVKSTTLENENAPILSVTAPSAAAGSVDSLLPPDAGGNLENRESGENSPRLIAAAQTLCDMATRSSNLNPSGMIRWPTKLSQKAMKARKSKSSEKPQETFALPKSTPISEDVTRKTDHMMMMPPKKPRLSIIDKRHDVGQANNNSSKRSLNWSTPPRSSRPSGKDLVTETPYSNGNIIKNLCMLPPPSARVLDKECRSQPKARNLVVPLDWNRSRGKFE